MTYDVIITLEDGSIRFIENVGPAAALGLVQDNLEILMDESPRMPGPSAPDTFVKVIAVKAHLPMRRPL